MTISKDGTSLEPSTRDSFDDFNEKLFCTPGRELKGIIAVGLVASIFFLGGKIILNLDRPFLDIWTDICEKHATIATWFVTGSVLAFQYYLSHLQARARKRDAFVSATELKASEREKILAVQRERETCVAATQKEHIRILEDFHPQKNMVEFFDDRSIYGAIMAMLRRLDRVEKSDNTRRYKVSMLLCSPALDYWGNELSRLPNNDKQEWGVEFRDIVHRLVVRQNLEFDICHLPFGSVTGVNAMEDFISALAAHIIQSEEQFKAYTPLALDAEFRKIHSTLMERSRRVWRDFEGLSNDDYKHRFHIKTHTINIPFQILLVTSNDGTSNDGGFMEVVVSFAGREVLERKQQRGVKGFFSSDPYVVKTFSEVFQTYVHSAGRIPYIPPHTSDISKQHDKMKEHVIPSYYHDLIGPLYVRPKSFSPVIGNSTKFTVWLLDKLLTTGKPGHFLGNKMRRILDVGSGTGVLALATSAILRDRCSHHDYTIIAIESCPHAQNVLLKNTKNDKAIDIKPWSLFPNICEKGELANAWFKDENGQKLTIEDGFSSFDLVIADLPFVHANERDESDRRFLDCDHALHQALFQATAQTKLLALNGLLITAFSSLGGPEDIAEFERHVSDNNLQVIQRVDFHESGYMWMVYALMKKNDYEKHDENLWWKVLDAKNSEPWASAS